MGPSAIRYARIEAALERPGPQGHRPRERRGAHPRDGRFGRRGQAPRRRQERLRGGLQAGRRHRIRGTLPDLPRRGSLHRHRDRLGRRALDIGGADRPDLGRRPRGLQHPRNLTFGNIHGMPLATLTGRGHPDLVGVGGQGASVRTEDVVIIGLRSVDLEEKNLLREAGVKVYTMREIDVYGAGRVVRGAIKGLAHVDRVHLSFDLDVRRPRGGPRRRHPRTRRTHLQGSTPPHGTPERSRHRHLARHGRGKPDPGHQERHSNASRRTSREPDGAQDNRPAGLARCALRAPLVSTFRPSASTFSTSGFGLHFQHATPGFAVLRFQEVVSGRRHDRQTRPARAAVPRVRHGEAGTAKS